MPKGKEKKPYKGRKGKGHYDRKPKHVDDAPIVPNENDWSWYAPTEQIAKDIASIPVSMFPGVQYSITRSTLSPTSQSTGTWNTQLENLMVLRYVPNKYYNNNRAWIQGYNAIRMTNSGARNGEPADYGMYIMGIEDIYSSYFEVKRLLDTIPMYTFENQAIPQAIFRAYNIDDQELRLSSIEVAALRAKLNVLAAQINSIPAPAFYKAFLRSVFVSSKIFKDSDSIRGQLYMYTKHTYYVWSSKKYNTGSALIAKNWNYGYETDAASKKISDYMDKLEEQINAIILNTDINDISRDILAKFKDGGMYQVPESKPEDIVELQYDENVLSQIENSFCIGSQVSSVETIRNIVNAHQVDTAPTDSSVCWDVRQEGGIILPYVETYSTAANSTAIVGNYNQFDNTPFNSHKNDPDYKDFLEWSRLISRMSFEKKVSTNQTFNRITFDAGHEILVYYEIIAVRKDSNGNNVAEIGRFTNTMNFSANPHHRLRIMQYDWHPFLFDSYGVIGGDCKNTTLLPKTISDRIHDAANYAMYYSPNNITLG